MSVYLTLALYMQNPSCIQEGGAPKHALVQADSPMRCQRKANVWSQEVHQQKPGEGEKAATERRREGPSAHTQGRGYRASLIGDFPSGG